MPSGLKGCGDTHAACLHLTIDFVCEGFLCDVYGRLNLCCLMSLVNLSSSRVEGVMMSLSSFEPMLNFSYDDATTCI